MKKKLLTLFLVCAMLLSNILVAAAENNTISGSNALNNAKAGKAYIIDVRSEVVHDSKGNLDHLGDYVIHQPLFVTVDGKNSLPAELEQPFIDLMTSMKEEGAFAEKDIYILCNSGASGAAKATELLTTKVGMDASKVFTIVNGAKGLEIRYAFLNVNNTVSGADTVKAVNTEGVTILDVRNTANYGKSHLDGAVSLPVFNAENAPVETADDELAKAFIDGAKANADLQTDKIYVLCNGGQRGARAATVLLADAGIDPANVYTITNGAKSIEVRYALLGVDNFVTGGEAVEAVGNDKIMILDVRNDAKYEAGHLKGSLHLAVFNADNKPVETAADALAVEFVDYVKANKAAFDSKEAIYVLCNGGQRGARAATVLLGDAGIDVSKVWTIEGGAGNAVVNAQFTKEVEITDYNTISGSDALNNAKAGKAYIIDVRSDVVHGSKGNLDNLGDYVIHQPLFITVDGKNSLPAELEQPFIDLMSSMNDADAFAEKDIYILCNSGASGAKKATELLVNKVGIGQSKVHTIVNGAKGIEIRHGFLVSAAGGENPTTPVTSTQALKAIGNENIIILDVRASGNYAAGHLKGAVSQPLFNSNGVVQTADDELAKAFVEYAKTVGDKEIYVLCNSGASGARAATVLLNDAGVDLAKVHTITGGYNKNEDIKAAATYVSDTRAVNATKEDDVVIIDVRSEDKYKAGHLEGSLSLPLFDKDNNLPDNLAEKFLTYVKTNMKDFEGKKIYILCNSGARGAQKATELLKEAGIASNVYTIEGGAKSEIIQKYFVTDKAEKPTGTPETGDSSNYLLYVLVMGLSLLAVLTVRKREFAK